MNGNDGIARLIADLEELARRNAPDTSGDYARRLAELLADLVAEDGAPDRVTPAFVRAAYVVMLDRLPESEATIQRALATRSRSDLRTAILSSPEYRRRNPSSVRLNNLPVDIPPIEVQTDLPSEQRARLFEHIRGKWTKLGEERAHWSVLSSPTYEQGITSEVETAFYATGKTERQMVEMMMARAGRRAGEFRRAVEFGCGLGRMTLQLAEMFPVVTGIDISSTHLAKAAAAAHRTGLTNIEFRLGDLEMFGMPEPFDFWYSRIVLQHNPPPLIHAILAHTLDRLAPGGLAIFQVPTYAVNYRFETKSYLSSRDGASDIEMHCLPQGMILDLIARSGCRLREIR